MTTAIFLTPVDMILFKMPFIRANMSSRTDVSLGEITRTTFGGRPGAYNALLFGTMATFVKYFFTVTSFNCYVNFYTNENRI